MLGRLFDVEAVRSRVWFVPVKVDKDCRGDENPLRNRDPMREENMRVMILEQKKYVRYDRVSSISWENMPLGTPPLWLRLDAQLLVEFCLFVNEILLTAPIVILHFIFVVRSDNRRRS
jgi:hypothetical protein